MDLNLNLVLLCLLFTIVSNAFKIDLVASDLTRLPGVMSSRRLFQSNTNPKALNGNLQMNQKLFSKMIPMKTDPTKVYMKNSPLHISRKSILSKLIPKLQPLLASYRTRLSLRHSAAIFSRTESTTLIENPHQSIGSLLDELQVTHIASAPPLRLTIDCSDERIPTKGSPLRSSFNTKKDLNIHSFCNLIHKAIPKAVKDGKFVHYDPDDQLGFGDTQMPIAITPPKGFIPDLGSTKFKVPKIRIPVLNVPKLQASMVGTKKPPKVGAPVTVISSLIPNDDSSAEKMEKLKKGVQKMLHFVKVLGQIDQYLTERIRIVVDKISKTFTE